MRVVSKLSQCVAHFLCFVAQPVEQIRFHNSRRCRVHNPQLAASAATHGSYSGQMPHDDGRVERLNVATKFEFDVRRFNAVPTITVLGMISRVRTAVTELVLRHLFSAHSNLVPSTQRQWGRTAILRATATFASSCRSALTINRMVSSLLRRVCPAAFCSLS